MTPIEQAFTDHRRLLWGLGYRMLGTTADADEVVQEAFERTLRKPPDLDRPLRPWLVRVTVNAARDRLRKRRRSPYVGPWLPAPIDESGGESGAVRSIEPTVDPELPGERLEQVSYALLVGLERLTPTQRAVWLLREVMGLSTAEAARVLEVQAGSVKVTLHRARKALGARPLRDPVDLAGGMGAVGALATAIVAGDVQAVAALLTEDVVSLSDGGGVYHAARKPVVGPIAVARLLVGLAAKNPAATYHPLWIHGGPAVLVESGSVRPDFAPRNVTLFGLRDGRVDRVWTVLAPAKLR